VSKVVLPIEQSYHVRANMAVSALDSRLFRNLFGTQEIRDVFTDSSYTQFMIETEAALARAQSKVGIIPSEAGQIITEAFKTVSIE
jgi:3-carboxy-cis,cis-muconate cycloisomerase